MPDTGEAEFNSTKHMLCHTCETVTDWSIVHRIVPYHGVMHCFRCKECGKVVPAFCATDYERTGQVVIGM